MKYILRNNLWMMIVAWCLEIEGHNIYALIVVALANIYIYANVKNINYLRCAVISLLFMIYCYLISSVTVYGYYKSFTLFLMLNSLNVGITNERLKKERLTNLYNIFVFGLVSFVVFFVSALLLPKYLISEIERINILSLVMIIFMPYSSTMLVNLIRKEYYKKQLLDKLEKSAKSKMFDIKA